MLITWLAASDISAAKTTVKSNEASGQRILSRVLIAGKADFSREQLMWHRPVGWMESTSAVTLISLLIFAAYTAAVTRNDFQWAGQLPKIASFHWGIWTPSNTWFLVPSNFPSDKFYDLWTLQRQSVSPCKLPELNCENFTTMDRFPKKTQRLFTKFSGLATWQARDTRYRRMQELSRLWVSK